MLEVNEGTSLFRDSLHERAKEELIKDFPKLQQFKKDNVSKILKVFNENLNNI